MKRIVLLATLFAAACAPNPGPRDAPLAAAWRGTQGPSIYALLGERERLNLSTVQVMALDSIAEALQERNRPWVDSLRAVTGSRSGGPVRPPRDGEEREAFLPLLARIAENNRAAVSAVEAALSPPQRQAVCELQREGREERRDGMRRGRGGPARGGGGMRPPPGMEGDTLGFGRRAGWPWCGATGPRRPPSAPTDTANAIPVRGG